MSAVKRSAKIYRFKRGKHTYWQVAWYDAAGKRRFKNRNSKAKAKTFADDIVGALASGKTQVVSAAQWEQFLQIGEIIKPTGKPMALVAREYVDVWTATGKPISELFEFWQAHHLGITSKTAAEILPELLASKKQDGRSDYYVKDLRTRLERFASHFKKPIGAISGPEIDAWLRGMKVSRKGKETDADLSRRSRNNYQDAVRAMWSFAKDKNYLADANKELKKVKAAKAPHGQIQIWTPDEMRKMLGRAGKKLLPYLLLRAFAGVRYAEGMRLRPSHISGEFVTVNAESSKVSERRLVPIQPNLRAWLDRLKLSDPICQEKHPGDRLPELARKCGFKPRHNALRDSFISYRLAVTQDIGKVANEAGNSPRMILNSYRELVTPAQGQAWFEIFPPAKIQRVRFKSA